MAPEAPKLLWDTRSALGPIKTFTAGKTFDDYRRDALLRSAVEKQFEIVGQALGKLRKVDPQTAISYCLLGPGAHRADRFDELVRVGCGQRTDRAAADIGGGAAVDLALAVGGMIFGKVLPRRDHE